ncbi:hypothetical protein K435DRAFT_385917 [Dendrothele bispora CBS 962.96]|uniref:Uncharacterized protein n=1 Tax=Dendrothele bispora (strain CBS 962.96) TaxID=1314807 RepID=A0A4S8LAM1_DENBC|nr:hypothetical protein K435DRAFT_385917 [Dendrothele bispora CBS 962.96]
MGRETGLIQSGLYQLVRLGKDAESKVVLQYRRRRIPSHYEHSPIYTLFIPFSILPYTSTDGRSWARREGFERHRGVRRGEELTDDEIDENDL